MKMTVKKAMREKLINDVHNSLTKIGLLSGHDSEKIRKLLKQPKLRFGLRFMPLEHLQRFAKKIENDYQIVKNKIEGRA